MKGMKLFLKYEHVQSWQMEVETPLKMKLSTPNCEMAYIKIFCHEISEPQG